MKMKLCFIGKYPPIEGGVSTSTYWLARGLAERGHEIHVITNADEVEDAYRLAFVPNDWPWYQPEFQATGGLVRVHNTEQFSRRTMGHIPAGNPFVSKLASLATDVVRAHDCDAIFSYYYEPYAIAGSLVARWTGRPLIIKHAGSDIDRLFRAPGLASAYNEIVGSADAVVTRQALMPRFLAMGVHRDRLVADIPFSVPTEHFNPHVEPLVLRSHRPGFIGDGLLGATTQSSGNGTAPVVGIYGKIGPTKGTFDLVSALGQLAGEGIDFGLLAMIGHSQHAELETALQQAGISERTQTIPFLPNWRVPAFIRACTAVCFLERDFPIAIHGPIVPREVLACGTCLVVSKEIASKQLYRDDLIPGENVVIVEDPKKEAGLAAALRQVLTQLQNTKEIGYRGYEDVSRNLEGFPAFVRGWEQLFLRQVHDSSYPAGHEFHSPKSVVSGPSDLELVAPDLVSLLQRLCPEMLDDFSRGLNGEDLFAAAIHCCDYMAKRAGEHVFGSELAVLLSAVTYEKARLSATARAGSERQPAFPVADCLRGREISEESVRGLRPIRTRFCRIEEFDFDVFTLFKQMAGSLEMSIADVRSERTLVLFHALPNSAVSEIRVGEATSELISLCDGTRSVTDLIEGMCEYFGAEESGDQMIVAERMLQALVRLHREGVLVFGEHRPGWGWTGGAISLRTTGLS